MSPDRMSREEIRAGASLAGVYGLRMLGLFFILPVFAVHAANLRGGGDLTLVGIALGAYGLAQGILQIPFGMASDRWGRKPVLYVGLLIFAAGSFAGIAADDIWIAIAARILQGAGAVNSVAMALAADLTREQHRTKIMAMIGGSIGLLFAMAVVKYLVPDPPGGAHEAPPTASAHGGLRDAELLRLNTGIFILHVLL